MMSKKILLNNSDVEYIKRLTSELTGSLADFILEQKEQEYYLYASSNRAKFKRLRIELSKKLLEIENIMYGRN